MKGSPKSILLKISLNLVRKRASSKMFKSYFYFKIFIIFIKIRLLAAQDMNTEFYFDRKSAINFDKETVKNYENKSGKYIPPPL